MGGERRVRAEIVVFSTLSRGGAARWGRRGSHPVAADDTVVRGIKCGVGARGEGGVGGFLENLRNLFKELKSNLSKIRQFKNLRLI